MPIPEGGIPVGAIPVGGIPIAAAPAAPGPHSGTFTELGVLGLPGAPQTFTAKTPSAGGRTTKNTDAFPLGNRLGMSWRMNN